MQAFLQKSKTDFQDENVIRGLTSFSLVNINYDNASSFWTQMFDLVAEQADIASLEFFVKMNLLWCLARNETNINLESY